MALTGVEYPRNMETTKQQTAFERSLLTGDGAIVDIGHAMRIHHAAPCTAGVALIAHDTEPQVGQCIAEREGINVYTKPAQPHTAQPASTSITHCLNNTSKYPHNDSSRAGSIEAAQHCELRHLKTNIIHTWSHNGDSAHKSTHRV